MPLLVLILSSLLSGNGVHAGAAASLELRQGQASMTDGSGSADWPAGLFAGSSAEELAEELAERIINTSSAKSREGNYAKLVEMARSSDAAESDAAKAALAECLPAVFAKAVNRLNTGAHVRAFKGLVAQKARVDKLREEARALIFDEALYPHPYAAPHASAEAIAAYTGTTAHLDLILTELRELGRSSESVRFSRELRDYSGRAQWARAQAKALLGQLDLRVGMPDFDGPAWMMGLPFELDAKALDLSNFAASPEEALRMSEDRAVDRWNEKALSEARGRAKGRAAKGELELAGAILRLTNEHRRSLGLGAAAWSDALHQAAQHHAEFLATATESTHEQPDEPFRTYRERARHFGYPADVLENCYFNLINPEIVFGVWLGSPGHHRAILWSPMRHIGVSHRKRRWVQVFGLDTAFGPEIQCHPWRN